MKRQLTQLTEEEASKARSIGRPKIVEVEHSSEIPFDLQASYEITRRAPKGANAFSRGKREDLEPASPVWAYAVQYYQVKER